MFILDANGNHRRTEHVALTFNSHITLICRSPTKGESLQWQFSVFDARDFKPVVSSASLTVDDTKRDDITLRITKVRFSMAGTYQCSNKLASRQINIHVYGSKFILLFFGDFICDVVLVSVCSPKVIYPLHQLFQPSFAAHGHGRHGGEMGRTLIFGISRSCNKSLI